MKFLLMTLALISLNTMAASDLEEHLFSGYNTGETLEIVQDGEIKKGDSHLCDLLKTTEQTLLSKEDGVYTFYIKEAQNRTCIDTTKEYIHIKTEEYYKKRHQKYVKFMNELGYELEFDKDTKILSFIGEEQTLTLDLKDVTTFEAYNMAITMESNYESGGITEISGAPEFQFIQYQDIPMYDADIEVIDERDATKID